MLVTLVTTYFTVACPVPDFCFVLSKLDTEEREGGVFRSKCVGWCRAEVLSKLPAKERNYGVQL